MLILVLIFVIFVTLNFEVSTMKTVLNLLLLPRLRLQLFPLLRLLNLLPSFVLGLIPLNLDQVSLFLLFEKHANLELRILAKQQLLLLLFLFRVKNLTLRI